MKYVYPAVFTEEGGKILVNVPDLPHIHTFGDDMADAIYMAQDAMAMWLDDAEQGGRDIPEASTIKAIDESSGDGPHDVSMVACDTDEYRRKISAKAVIKSVSIPEWLDFRARRAEAPLSAILQKGLKEYLHIED
ncbi:MAG: type II toxin-antitoxin system HicB family antitoxin [Clostridiales Family XIII bacterium]|nr:type II toxin-antitoxin system HicB family antitoxin [Clostridiales Family XIII bacterium]